MQRGQAPALAADDDLIQEQTRSNDRFNSWSCARITAAGMWARWPQQHFATQSQCVHVTEVRVRSRPQIFNVLARSHCEAVAPRTPRKKSARQNPVSTIRLTRHERCRVRACYSLRSKYHHPSVSYPEPGWRVPPEQEGGRCKHHQEKDKGHGFRRPAFQRTMDPSLRTRCRNSSLNPSGKISNIVASLAAHSAANRSASPRHNVAPNLRGCGTTSRRRHSR